MTDPAARDRWRKRAWIAALIPLATAQEAAAQQPERWELAATLRIGSMDEPNSSLTQVRDITVASDGRIYVAQPQEQLIRVFNRDGTFIRSIGRRGNGPGEFSGLANLGWQGDTLYAIDLDLQRVSFFTAEGEHLRTMRVVSEPSAPFRPAAPVGLLRDGSVVAQSPVPPNLGLNGQSATVPVLQLERSGRVMGAIHRRLWRNQTGMIRRDDSIIMFRQPVRSGTLYSLAPDGRSIAFVDSEAPTGEARSSFSLIALASAADTLFSRRYFFTPRRIPPSVVDSIRESLIESLAANRLSRREAAEAVAQHAHIPVYQPPVSRILVGRTGTIWLRMGGLDGTQVDWLVLESSGSIRGVVRTPRKLELLEADDAEVWGVTHDELDIPYVVRYRVIRGVSSPG